MALGLIVPPERLYEPRNPTQEASIGYYVYEESPISQIDRHELRKNVRTKILENPSMNKYELYDLMLQLGLIPTKNDGDLINRQSFAKYFNRCAQDIKDGVSDDLVCELYISGISVPDIVKKTGISYSGVKDRLICNGVFRRKNGISE